MGQIAKSLGNNLNRLSTERYSDHGDVGYNEAFSRQGCLDVVYVRIGYQESCKNHLVPTPVSFPVNQPKGVLILPPRGPKPPPPNDRGLDDANDSFRVRDAS